MHLSRLYIQNFRSIEKLDLKFKKGRNIIVGRNNAGKSNIVKAIDLILGEYSPTSNKSDSFLESDFFCSDTTKQVFIWCEIVREASPEGELEHLDFSDVSKSAFHTIHDKYGVEHRIPVSTFNDAEIKDLFEFCTDEGQARIDSGEFKKRWIGGKPYCKATFADEFNRMANFAIGFLAQKDESDKLRKDLIFLYREHLGASWVLGINCNLRTILLQSAIIPAFRDPKDQLRISSYSWFGKLLKAYIKSDSPELLKAFEGVRKASGELFQELEQTIVDTSIDVAFPNTTISFLFNADTKQDIHKGILIYINDGFNSELKDKGAGIQSAVMIGLFDFYIRNIAHNGKSLLAIEEPELYLHPHGRRVISDRLNSFIGKEENQVIITTHSPEFLSSIHENQNVISVRKNGVSTVGRNIYFNTPKRKQILIKKQNSEMFFADAVILSEGADKYFIEEAAKDFGEKTIVVNSAGKEVQLGKNWLNNYNVSVINCGGKQELYKYAGILGELGSKVISTADFDFLREGLNDYFSNLGYGQTYLDALNAIKSQIIAAVGKGKYKSIKQLENKVLEEKVIEYLNSLKQSGVFIFTGELENFYKIKPSMDKEAGVIETLGKIIEDEKSLAFFVDTSEYSELLTLFVENKLGLTIKKEDEHLLDEMSIIPGSTELL